MLNQIFGTHRLREALRQGSEAYSAAEIVLKGPEERLPPGMSFLDKDRHKREEVRIRWWDANTTTFRKAAIGMDDRLKELPNSELPTDYRTWKRRQYYSGIIG
jgi:hypothetical protein